MTAYWDTSALIEVIHNSPRAVAAFQSQHDRITRAHTLAEVFSHLTGGRLLDQFGNPFRLTANSAAHAIEMIAASMKIVTLDALKVAQKRAVRGGAVHDLLHARAAEISTAEKIYTLNLRNFTPITALQVSAP